MDMRIDYLAPATGEELVAEAEPVQTGDGVAAVEVDVTDGEGTTVATARGTYKAGGEEGGAWREDDATE